MVPTAEFEAMLEQAREYRAQVDELPDRAEIDGAIRAEVKFLPHPPEPPPRHGRLIADILELLRDEQLSPEQAAGLETVFLGDPHVDPS